MIPKKVAIIVAVLTFLISVFGSYSFFAESSLGSSRSSYQSPADEIAGTDLDEGPKTEECPINGKLMTKAQKAVWEGHRPLGMMIENHLDARPQSGLSRADVIYELVAEGGITRFLAIYHCDNAEIVGPVRSARIYFVRLLQGYGNLPLYGHVGGANTPGPADSLGEIRNLGWDGYNDLNQFAVAFPNYYRDYERLPNRATEHTMYSSTSKLWEYAANERGLSNVDEDGVSWDETFNPWTFQKDAKAGSRGSVSKISFGFWDQFANDYSVVWNYNKEDNTYARVNGGKPFIDKNNDKQIKAKNVFVVFADESSANDGYPGGHLLYDIVGSGDGIFFQNGHVIEGTWEKEDEEAQMRFFDEDGEEIAIVGGQVWVEILPTGNEVEY